MAASRRSILAGALAAPFAARSGASAAAARPTQAEIAKRVSALAEELSMLLGDLDDGSWQMRVSPPFQGQPVVHAEPTHLSPEAHLRRAIALTNASLNRLYPGAWRTEFSADNAVLLFIDDNWQKGKAGRGGITAT